MRLRLLFLLVLAPSVALYASQWAEKLDLNRLLTNPEALSTLVIRYQPNRTEVLYVYGTGKVVHQNVSPHLSDALVPTCTGRISEEQVQDLIRFMLARHFFDLPINSYYYSTASDDEDDYWNAVKLHSIIMDDGISRARRDFAAGVWLDKQKTLPTDFVVVEEKLRAIQDVATGNKPCHLAPGIRLPVAQQPTIAPQEFKWFPAPTKPAT